MVSANESSPASSLEMRVEVSAFFSEQAKKRLRGSRVQTWKLILLNDTLTKANMVLILYTLWSFMRLSIRTVLHLLRFYPPYFGAGVSVKHINEDLTSITVQMKMRFWNRNYVGTHFGGSLYSMCDPWYMFILLEHLGKDCVVWDKGAEIDFVSPGKGTTYATFEIPISDIERLREEAEDNQKHFPIFCTTVTDEAGTVVATLRKTLYMRKKREKLMGAE